ncbi:hypothetical protein [Streptomyces agglomeratus]|uniref:hypothetical protein n=1 Tax=Streptomyces agglomeratus TaxID=285458 RepID=UPI001428CEAB|nr:hypothetical protein [Streptomyces agglomeratus]
MNQANTGLVASTAGLVFGEADLIGSSVAQTLAGARAPVRLRTPNEMIFEVVGSLRDR